MNVLFIVEDIDKQNRENCENDDKSMKISTKHDFYTVFTEKLLALKKKSFYQDGHGLFQNWLFFFSLTILIFSGKLFFLRPS